MLAEYLPQLLLAWSIQWLGVISPGPGVALILSVAVTKGRGPAILTCFGIGCASVILSLATVLGIAVLFAQAAGAMQIVRWFGAAYLAFLAYKSFRTAVTLPPLNLSAETKGSGVILSGFLMQLLNPKAIFFWLAVAAAGGIGAAPWPIVAIFVAGAFLNSFLGHGAWGVLLSSGIFRRAYLGARGWVEGALGGVFLFASYKLATERV